MDFVIKKGILSTHQFYKEFFMCLRSKKIRAEMRLKKELKANWKHISGNTFTETHLETPSQKHIQISNFIN